MKRGKVTDCCNFNGIKGQDFNFPFYCPGTVEDQKIWGEGHNWKSYMYILSILVSVLFSIIAKFEGSFWCIYKSIPIYLLNLLIFTLQSCNMQLTDEPEKRCYPLGDHLYCRSCHIRQGEKLGYTSSESVRCETSILIIGSNNQFRICES